MNAATSPASAPSPAAAAACRDLIWQSLLDTLDLLASYTMSARESAWRGDQITFGVHALQIRACTTEMICLKNEIDAPGAERGAA